ncbi:SdpI family protein [Ligilactobacillus agilis]|uniref:SdpI family protein n=1 Tax=Ligilactobacillus agilis TaxID=1601 RepID=UPI00255C78AF|nr:SdpI family protein [Ligilactobacillus agilis]
MNILFGIVFIVLGLVCLVVKPNHYVGIRLPWTLNDPKVWHQTNRLAGGLGIIIGLVI